MRDFWNPYYEGPQCVCCKPDYEDVIKFLETLNSVCADYAIEAIREEYEKDETD